MVRFDKKDALLRWLDGQRRAQAVIDAEEKHNLRGMSRSARLAAFNALCDLWRSRTVSRRRELDTIRIPSIVELRRRLQLASRGAKRERDH